MNEEKEKLEYRVHVRLAKKKYDELIELLSRTRGMHSLSELVRHILMDKPVSVKTYNASFEKVTEQLAQIRKELNAIGRNIHQVTRKFHAQQWPQAMLVNALEITKLYQQADLKVSELFTVIANISKEWLPE